MTPAAGAGYSLSRVQDTLGLSRTVIRRLIEQGFVSPARGARNELRFSFQDLVLLRTAYGLQRADIPPRKIVEALSALRSTLPAELPLTGLRITAEGASVVVRERDVPRDAVTGQLVMDFAVSPSAQGPEVTVLSAPAPKGQEDNELDALFLRGENAEAHDRLEAERAYRAVIALDATHVEAFVNLGALLCEEGRCDEAVWLYESAVAAGNSDPILHFNHAIALEDVGRLTDALASYELALRLDANFADAHYNAGCLMERLGDAQGALRHFSAYRRLAPS